MDVLSFVVDMTGALAWPVTVVVLLLLVRKPLLARLPALNRFRYGELEFEFGRVLGDALQREPAADKTCAVDPKITRLAAVSPRSVVVESWRELQHAAVAALRADGDQFAANKVASPKALLARIRRRQLLSPEQLETLDELRILRNKATHAPAFALSAQSALEYRIAINALIEAVNSGRQPAV